MTSPKTFGRHTIKTGVDFIFNPKLGGFFESNSTPEIDFGADPTDILANAGGLYPQGFSTPGAVIGMSGSPAILTSTCPAGPNNSASSCKTT